MTRERKKLRERERYAEREEETWPPPPWGARPLPLSEGNLFRAFLSHSFLAFSFVSFSSKRRNKVTLNEQEESQKKKETTNRLLNHWWTNQERNSLHRSTGE